MHHFYRCSCHECLRRSLGQAVSEWTWRCFHNALRHNRGSSNPNLPTSWRWSSDSSIFKCRILFIIRKLWSKDCYHGYEGGFNISVDVSSGCWTQWQNYSMPLASPRFYFPFNIRRSNGGSLEFATSLMISLLLIFKNRCFVCKKMFIQNVLKNKFNGFFKSLNFFVYFDFSKIHQRSSFVHRFVRRDHRIHFGGIFQFGKKLLLEDF